MTLNERVRVVKLTKALYPTEVEIYRSCTKDCATCRAQIVEWNDLIWRVYRALIDTNLM